MMKRTFQYLLFIALVLSLIACQSSAEIATPEPTSTRIIGELTPYASKTPENMAQISEAVVTLTPVPSPTPQVHVVALDETLISIAYKYGITLEALQNANPEVDPYAIYVGDELFIPYVETTEGEAGSTTVTADPEPVELSEVICYPEASGGAWCLWTATNPTDSGTENILVEIQLQQGETEIRQQVTAPVNISQAGQRVPMGAFFSAQELSGFSQPYQASLTLQQALPLNNTAARYVPVALQDGLITLTADLHSAVITGNITLKEGVTTSASSVWVIAAAYDTEDQLVGFRRWTQETALSAEVSLPLEMQVFALDNQTIETVEILLEAHP